MIQPTVRHAALSAALFLLGLTRVARAQDAYYTKNAVIKSSVDRCVFVGFATYGDINKKNPTSPTVSLVNGGSILSNFFAYNSSKVTISGGTVFGSLYAWHNSRFTLSGGSISGDLNAYTASTITISGGNTQGNLEALDSSIVNLRGGSIAGYLHVTDSSTLNLFGLGLSKTLVNPNAALSGAPGRYVQYTLSGKLSDGTSINGKALYMQKDSKVKLTFNNTAASPRPQP